MGTAHRRWTWRHYELVEKPRVCVGAHRIRSAIGDRSESRRCGQRREAVKPATERSTGSIAEMRPSLISQESGRGVGRVFFILNRIDYLDPDERRRAADFLQKVLF